ncbi:MAG: hypothetical protein SFV18_03945 [Bryobacteraceae bacterium]|nr:hypothetical protein [Bryobacteraceae bacterium]
MSRYYRGETRLNNSNEITGYAVRAFLHLDLPVPAMRAGEYLLGQWDPKLRILPFEPASGLAYFFDCGIVVRGLLALWRTTGEERWLAAARDGGESMMRDFAAPDGYHPILRLPSKSPEPYEDWWSRNPGCFQLKAALAWRELYEDTGEARFAEHFERQTAFAIEKAPELIDIETEPLKIMDRLHAYCYFLEGLLPDADRHEELLREGVREIGELWRALAPRFLRSDVLAQLTRLKLLLGEDADGEITELIRFATPEGAFLFGERDGAPIPHRNPVSTAFAVQALDWAEQGPPASWRELI